MTRRTLIAAALLASSILPALAAKLPSDATKLREQAEHICYGDVQKLCNDSIPDEDKIKACMQTHHGQLSPACAKIYDQGIEG